MTPDQTFSGAWFSGLSTTSVQFRLYNDDVLVHTSAVLFTTATPTFLASGYSGLVDVVGVFSNANDYYVMDDVTYSDQQQTAPIPEPATMLLLSTGLAGVAAKVRRRRNAHKGDDSQA